MERNRFVVLALIAFGCVLASFTTLGFGRLLVGYRTGLLLAAPFGLLAFVLVVVLFDLGLDRPDRWTTGVRRRDRGVGVSRRQVVPETRHHSHFR